jgi:uncharacterized GH25 family protein
MSLFSGYCEGGPLHGKVLHHGAPVYEATVINNKIVTRSQDARKVSKEPDVKFFTYRHKNGRWICKP